MSMLSSQLGRLKIWQAVLTLVILAGAGGGVYWGTAMARGSSQNGVAAGDQVVAAQMGNLTKSVTVSGNISFPDQETASFLSQGTVAQVGVNVGDTVQAGQTLAQLNAATVALLQSNVANEMVAIDQAQTALTNLQSSTTTDLQNAEQAYQQVYMKFLGITLSPSETLMSPDALLKQWGIDLTSLFAPPTSAGGYDRSLITNNPATPWNETVVAFWRLGMYPGGVEATCGTNDSATVPTGTLCIRKEMDDAWQALENAADAAYSGPGQGIAALASNNLTDSPRIAAAKAKLAVAQSDLTQAQDALANAALKAPIAGVITSQPYSVGQSVTPGTAGIVIQSTATVDVSGSVAETDVLSVKQGDRAIVTLDALPGQRLPGTLQSIGAASTSSQGVVTYPVTILVQPPQGVTLQAGLTATAVLPISQESNVLLIPVSAVRGTFQQPYVQLVSSNGTVTDQNVQVGASDSFWTVVTSGLQAGDKVTMPAPSSTGGNTGAAFFTRGGGILGGLGGGTFRRQDTGGGKGGGGTGGTGATGGGAGRPSGGTGGAGGGGNFPRTGGGG